MVKLNSDIRFSCIRPEVPFSYKFDLKLLKWVSKINGDADFICFRPKETFCGQVWSKILKLFIQIEI